MTKPMQASKWLKSQMLIDTEEMVDLFSSLPPFSLYIAGSVTPKGKGALEPRAFLDSYHDYISSLRQGMKPDLNRYRQHFSAAMTTTKDALFTLPIDEEKELIRIQEPVVQMQLHTMEYNAAQSKFLSMVLGPSAITWGIQFSYPQLFQSDSDIVKVDDAFANTPLFRALQKWTRNNTVPTPFLIDGLTVNASQRLGKRCLSWINNHPDLGRMHVATD